MLFLFFASVIGMCAYEVGLKHQYLVGLSINKFASHNGSKPRKDDNDVNPKFTIMRSKGQPFAKDKKTHRTDLILDALSFGTQYNLSLLLAQQTTWASHKSICYYFTVTKLDDANPTCHKTLNRMTTENIVHLCRMDSLMPRVG